jgi:hypothetical protein
MCSKTFSSIMTARAFKLLDKHGTRFQFGGTPELGCWDGLFTLKALLNGRRNHDLASYVGFIDLVKAYDTANHDLLLRILERYGAPPKFVAAIQTIYTDNVRPEDQKRNSRNPSNSWSAPRRQHGTRPIPLPHDCIC